MRKQNSANRDIARNVEDIAQMTEETSAIVRNVALSAEQLENLSVAMSESVHRFCNWKRPCGQLPTSSIGINRLRLTELVGPAQRLR